jgi:hypothetical protein
VNQFRKDQLALSAVEAELSKPAPTTRLSNDTMGLIAGAVIGAVIAASAAFGGVSYLVVAIAFAIAFSFYMLPTILLAGAGRPWLTMAFINLFCGWSIIGWLVCFVLVFTGAANEKDRIRTGDAQHVSRSSKHA